MAELQVAYLQDIMPISRIEPLQSVDIPGIRIYGKNLLSTVSVLINGLESPSFVVLNRGQVVAELPTSVIGDIVRSVAALSNRVLTTERSVVTFRLGGRSSKVVGIMRLVQRYVTMLLTTPGADIIHPQLGGGLLQIIGRPVRNKENIQAAVQQAVSKASSDLKRVQSTTERLAEDEILVTAQLASVYFDPRTTTLAIRVQVVSAAGDAALANLFI